MLSLKELEVPGTALSLTAGPPSGALSSGREWAVEVARAMMRVLVKKTGKGRTRCMERLLNEAGRFMDIIGSTHEGEADCNGEPKANTSDSTA